MPLPAEKQFPIAVRWNEAPTIAATVELDPIARIGRELGAEVATTDGHWQLTGPGTSAVAIERLAHPRGQLLRFCRTVGPPPATDRATELVRANSRMAFAGWGVQSDRLVLTSTLVESTADDDEIRAVLLALGKDGEPLVARTAADTSGYKLTAAPGAFEDELLRRALGGTGIAFERSGQRADTLVRLDGGRTQRVHLFFDRATTAGEAVIQMLSVCGPPQAAHVAMALRSNPNLTFATIALASVGGQEHLVVVRSQLAKTADPEEILLAVTDLAHVGDRIESELTGGKDLR